MHLVFRLSGPPLRVFRDAGDLLGICIAEPVVGGARSSFYAKDMGAPVLSVGAQLLPGAAQALFGVSADELAERHTPLSELWGSGASTVLEQLCYARSPRQQLAMLENILVARLLHAEMLHPAVADALSKLTQAHSVQDVVRAGSYSHRGFIALFKQATGLAPKRYARLMRFQNLLTASRAPRQLGLAELALSSGYSDQAHMNREFNGTTLMLSDEFPEFNILGPRSIGGTTFSIHLHVDNADTLVQRALDAGATLEMAPQDQFYGERTGVVHDPFGHRWMIGHGIEDMTPQEMQRRYTAMMQGQ